MAVTALAALKKASQGLSYMSEKDAPFGTFSWKAEGKLTRKKVLELGKHPADSAVEEVKLAPFFAGLTKDQDWHGTQEKAAVEKYRHLLQAIQDNLEDVKVFKVGQARKTVYIVGSDKDGNWTGLTTQALET